ncbi:STAS-like domain-containing protein [Methylobacter luteus]|jgi:hypothetical protein|uniref:STAS-like domain-containing protein n=1 Tax=Methylobacter luteus TaxID=415 RepID=UPI00040D7159|nr:DUF4325 domain-containing protein [Methylobacter luteus]
MISLKEFFKRNTKNAHGSRLAKLVSTELYLSKEPCEIDFADVSHLSPVFFQDFIFPLVLEFGSQTLSARLKFANLREEHINAYRTACNQTTDHIDKLLAQDVRPFGEISDLTCELLIKARELSRNDPATAKIIFGINHSMIDFFANMDMEQIRRVAGSGVICFEPRFTPEFAAKLAALEAHEMDVFLHVVGGLEDTYEPAYA